MSDTNKYWIAISSKNRFKIERIYKIIGLFLFLIKLKDFENVKICSIQYCDNGCDLKRKREKGFIFSFFERKFSFFKIFGKTEENELKEMMENDRTG